MTEVDPEALTSASTSVNEVAATLRDIDVAGPFAPLQESLVGSQTSQGTLWLSTRLAAAVLVYADEVGALGSAIGDTAQQWRSTDDGVRRRLGQVPR